MIQLRKAVPPYGGGFPAGGAWISFDEGKDEVEDPEPSLEDVYRSLHAKLVDLIRGSLAASTPNEWIDYWTEERRDDYRGIAGALDEIVATLQVPPHKRDEIQKRCHHTVMTVFHMDHEKIGFATETARRAYRLAQRLDANRLPLSADEALHDKDMNTAVQYRFAMSTYRIALNSLYAIASGAIGGTVGGVPGIVLDRPKVETLVWAVSEAAQEAFHQACNGQRIRDGLTSVAGPSHVLVDPPPDSDEELLEVEEAIQRYEAG